MNDLYGFRTFSPMYPIVPAHPADKRRRSAELSLSLAVRLLVESQKQTDAEGGPTRSEDVTDQLRDAAVQAVGSALDAAKDAGSPHTLPVYRDGYVITYNRDGDVTIEACRAD